METDQAWRVAGIAEGHTANELAPPVLPPDSKKRARLPANQCQVDGCQEELALPYQQKTKVCGTHLRSSSILFGSQESGFCRMRYCQKCGRFEPINAFDNDKRTCRTALEMHNARRRKQPRPAAPLCAPSAAAAACKDASNGSRGSNHSTATAAAALEDLGGLLASLTDANVPPPPPLPLPLLPAGEELQLCQLASIATHPELAAAVVAQLSSLAGTPSLSLPLLLSLLQGCSQLQLPDGLMGTPDGVPKGLPLLPPSMILAQAAPAQLHAPSAALGSSLEALAAIQGLQQLLGGAGLSSGALEPASSAPLPAAASRSQLLAAALGSDFGLLQQRAADLCRSQMPVVPVPEPLSSWAQQPPPPQQQRLVSAMPSACQLLLQHQHQAQASHKQDPAPAAPPAGEDTIEGAQPADGGLGPQQQAGGGLSPRRQAGGGLSPRAAEALAIELRSVLQQLHELVGAAP